jgi:hypothetical protein
MPTVSSPAVTAAVRRVVLHLAAVLRVALRVLRCVACVALRVLTHVCHVLHCMCCVPCALCRTKLIGKPATMRSCVRALCVRMRELVCECVCVRVYVCVYATCSMQRATRRSDSVAVPARARPSAASCSPRRVAAGRSVNRQAGRQAGAVSVA